MPRFRVRTQMIAVAVVALLLAAIGPGRQVYRRWSYHRAQAATFARLESKELQNAEQERTASADREAIRADLIKLRDFVAKDSEGRERVIDRVAESHKFQAEQALGAARSWAQKRRDSETAAFWAFDPFAPDAP
jgi:hypothetical protein